MEETGQKYALWSLLPWLLILYICKQISRAPSSSITKHSIKFFRISYYYYLCYRAHYSQSKNSNDSAADLFVFAFRQSVYFNRPHDANSAPGSLRLFFKNVIFASERFQFFVARGRKNLNTCANNSFLSTRFVPTKHFPNVFVRI